MLVGQGPGYDDQCRIEDAGHVVAIGRITRTLVELLRDNGRLAASDSVKKASLAFADGIVDACHDSSFDEAIADCAVAAQTWRRHTDEDEKIKEIAARFATSPAMPAVVPARVGMWTQVRRWLGGAQQ